MTTKSNFVIVPLIAVFLSVMSGCMYLDRIDDISSAAQASFYGYNKELTINSNPQGAYVLIEENGTYKTLGQTPLKYYVDFNSGSNTYYTLLLARPGYHNQNVKMISAVNNSNYLTENRKHLTAAFVADCFFVVPLPFNILIGLPRASSIPDEAFSCDYLGAKIVYNNEPVVLIPDNVPLPQVAQAQPAQESQAADNSAAIALAIAQGANAFSAAMSQQATPQPVIYNPSVQPANYATANTGASAVQTKTISYKRKCGIHDIEYDIRYGGCPTCKASKFGFGTEVKCNNCGYMHFAGKHCPVCNQ